MGFSSKSPRAVRVQKILLKKGDDRSALRPIFYIFYSEAKLFVLSSKKLFCELSLFFWGLKVAK